MIYLPFLFVVLLLLKVPIGFILGIIATIGLYIGGYSLRLLPSRYFAGIDSFVLLAIPFFLLTGEIMKESGITHKIINFSESVVGNLKGGLGHVNVLASIIFAGISGVAVADTAAIGSILIPGMTDVGYPKPYATAITAASSIIGPIIPPSMSMVVYGATVNMSIAGLFAAGMLPGLLMGLSMMVMNHIICTTKGYEVKEKAQTNYFENLRKTFLDGFLALLLPIILIGGILGGVFSPTEAAAVSAGYAFILAGVIYKTLSFKQLVNVFKRTVILTGVAMILVSMGRVLSWLVTIEMLAPFITERIQSVVHSSTGFLIVSAIILLIVGTFNDLTASIIIFGPILTPVAIQFGIAPFHFALMMVLALNIGLVTPPVGGVLFVAAPIAKLKMEEIVKALIPFYFCLLFVLAIVIFFEPLTMYLPTVLGFVHQR